MFLFLSIFFFFWNFWLTEIPLFEQLFSRSSRFIIRLFWVEGCLSLSLSSGWEIVMGLKSGWELGMGSVPGNSVDVTSFGKASQGWLCVGWR